MLEALQDAIARAASISIPTHSSWISSASWSPVSQRLYIMPRSGHGFSVGAGMFDAADFASAGSQGLWTNARKR